MSYYEKKSTPAVMRYNFRGPKKRKMLIISLFMQITFNFKIWLQCNQITEPRGNSFFYGNEVPSSYIIDETNQCNHLLKFLQYGDFIFTFI